MPLRQRPLAPEIDAYLRKQGSPLAGLGGAFAQAGTQYGVDPRLMVAISGAESSLGKYGPSQSIHNPFGMGPNINYPSYGAAISALAANLSKNYLGQGLNTIAEISTKYAPAGASNDPHSLNSNWVRNVTQYYKELGGSGDVSDPITTKDVASYAQTAASLESQYADAGQGPDLTMKRAAGPTPEQTAAIDQKVKAIGQLLNPPSYQPFALTDSKQRVQPYQPLDTSGGSFAYASQAIQDKLRKELSANLAQHNVDVHWDDGTVVSPDTAKIVGSAGEYMAQHPWRGKLLTQAKGFLGTPYVWGGESPKTGFDCSGFAQWLYGQRGINISRTTYTQIKEGQPVGIKNLMPGDLIFFGTRKDPHHEGIYLGNGQFIHAPHTGDVVKISPLSGSYRREFVTGRRIVA
jgi:cell wall-associated NlpC family hydrolase